MLLLLLLVLFCLGLHSRNIFACTGGAFLLCLIFILFLLFIIVFCLFFFVGLHSFLFVSPLSFVILTCLLFLFVYYSFLFIFTCALLQGSAAAAGSSSSSSSSRPVAVSLLRPENMWGGFAAACGGGDPNISCLYTGGKDMSLSLKKLLAIETLDASTSGLQVYTQVHLLSLYTFTVSLCSVSFAVSVCLFASVCLLLLPLFVCFFALYSRSFFPNPKP